MEGMTGKEGGVRGGPANSGQPKGMLKYFFFFLFLYIMEDKFLDDKLTGQDPLGRHDTEATLLSAENVKAAAMAGLAAAATKAKLFADHEEREIQRLSANIVNHQVLQLWILLLHKTYFLRTYII